MSYRYDAFISFAWPDLKRARWLHNQLTAAGYVTWYAEQDLRGGSDIPKELWLGLEMSRYIFVVHSKHYTGAVWAERELSVATSDEINSKITKIVFLTYDDEPVPFGMRHKLYIDFRNRNKQPLSQLEKLLDNASSGVIRGAAAAMIGSTDIAAIRADAARLSGIARLRGESLVVDELRDMLLRPSTPRHASDSAAWAIGDIGLWALSTSLAERVKDTVEQCIASGDSRLTAHMAWIAGEVYLGACRPDMRQWADALIAKGEMSLDPDAQKDFKFTRQRIAGLFRAD
jgi:TIR domain